MSPAASSPSLPATMQAWVRQRRGPPDTSLKLASGLPVPALPAASSADVLIRVSYVSLQFSSAFIMNLLPRLPFTGPWIPELEFSGEIVAAGSAAPAEVRDIGAHVVAFQTIPNLMLGNGIMAEYVRLPGTQVVPLDAAVDMTSASGVVGAGCTAMKMMRTAGLQQGHKVLINGASGSVGSVLTQLCKLRGARVVGVASGGNEAVVRGFGADEFIDYQKHDALTAHLAEQYRDAPFDFVFDCVGSQALYVDSPAYLKPQGAVINIGSLDQSLATVLYTLPNMLRPTWLGGVPRRYVMFSTPPQRDDSVHLAQLLREGKLRVPVDSVFDLKDALRAYERVGTKRARGKVVVKVRQD